MQKKHILILLIVNIVLVAAFAAAVVCYRHYAGLLQVQQTAARWRGDSEDRFSQVSCFRPVGRELKRVDVEAFRADVKKALTEASYETDTDSGLWTDAMSARSTVTLKTGRASVAATAYAIDGQFFTFHPLQLISGSYISGSDFARDGVVLTESLAWSLFGASDIAGMDVTIDGRDYRVIGVVEPERDAADAAAQCDEPCVYLQLDALYKPEDAAIDCYEIVLVNPVRSFAKNVVLEHMPEGGEVIENSARYQISALSDLVTRFGHRSMNTYGILYPYWENAARYTEDMAALYLLLALLAAIIPGVTILALIVLLYIGIQRKGRRMAARMRGI